MVKIFEIVAIFDFAQFEKRKFEILPIIREDIYIDLSSKLFEFVVFQKELPRVRFGYFLDFLHSGFKGFSSQEWLLNTVLLVAVKGVISEI